MTEREEGFLEGMRAALAKSKAVADQFWTDEFARHGNRGLATMKSKVAYEIERVLIDEITARRGEHLAKVRAEHAA